MRDDTTPPPTSMREFRERYEERMSRAKHRDVLYDALAGLHGWQMDHVGFASVHLSIQCPYDAYVKGSSTTSEPNDGFCVYNVAAMVEPDARLFVQHQNTNRTRTYVNTTDELRDYLTLLRDTEGRAAFEHTIEGRTPGIVATSEMWKTSLDATGSIGRDDREQMEMLGSKSYLRCTAMKQVLGVLGDIPGFTLPSRVEAGAFGWETHPLGYKRTFTIQPYELRNAPGIVIGTILRGVMTAKQASTRDNKIANYDAKSLCEFLSRDYGYYLNGVS